MQEFSIEIEALRDALTEQVSKEPQIIEAARDVFYGVLKNNDVIVEADFLDWLIWDYAFEGKKLVERYQVALKELFAPAVLEAAKSSRLCFVQWMPTSSGGFFKDVLTNKDFHPVVVPDELKADHILMTRFCTFDGHDHPVGEWKYYDLGLKESIRRGMLEKYNEANQTRLMTIEDFVYGNPLVIYAYAEIIDVVAELSDDEQYAVYQAIYKILDSKLLLKRLNEDSTVQKTEDDDVFIMTLEETAIAELVFGPNHFDVEATDSEKLALFKAHMKAHYDDCLEHVQDEVLSMDDLLG